MNDATDIYINLQSTDIQWYLQISTGQDSPPVRFANLQVMIAAAARQLVAGSKWITKEATKCKEFGEAAIFDVWSLTMQRFFLSKIGIFLVSLDLCYQDVFMFSCPKDADYWAHVRQTFDSRMEQIRGEYFKELRIMQAQWNSSSCFEVLGWLPPPMCKEL